MPIAKYLSEHARAENRSLVLTIVDRQSSQVVEDNPSTAIPRVDAANCFRGAVSDGQNGGMSWKIDEGEADKFLPNFVTSLTRSMAHESKRATSLPNGDR